MKPPVFNPNWPDDVKAIYQHDMEEIWDRSIAPHLWNRYQNLINTYLNVAGPAPLDILDVGCAQATLAILLAEMGHRVTAVDIRPQFLDYARSRYTSGDIQFLVANVLEDPLPGKYDLVFANQIIEHLVYPEVFLERLCDVLRPGGRLIVTTPNGGYLVNKLPSFRELGDPRDWEHMQHTADGDGHFYAYLKRELIETFERVGMHVLNATFFESPWISGHMKFRFLHFFIPSVLLENLDKLTLSSEWLSQRLGHQLMIVGQRSN